MPTSTTKDTDAALEEGVKQSSPLDSAKNHLDLPEKRAVAVSTSDDELGNQTEDEGKEEKDLGKDNDDGNLSARAHEEKKSHLEQDHRTSDTDDLVLGRRNTISTSLESALHGKQLKYAADSSTRKRTAKRTKLKLKRLKDLKAEIVAAKKQFATFESAYNNTLAYYFLLQYCKERHLSACFEFINAVDVFKSLEVPTKATANRAMRKLHHLAFVQNTQAKPDKKDLHHRRNVTPRNALRVTPVALKIAAGDIDEAMFDECYERVKEVLVSFYGPFLKSACFERFVQIYEYSTRTLSPSDLQALAPLGQGAFGRVLAVVKKDTHTLYAMKEIPKAVLRKNRTGWMCLNEMQLLSRTDSPFVLNLKYSFHSERAVHLVFEMCMGGDLRQYLEKGPFSLERSRFYLAEILLGIDHIHSLEYAYRDLKPSNILLTEDGHCKISDLGLVVKLPKPPKILKHVAGTPGYWPPEIVSRTGTYRSSDFWSLGVLLYVMLTGKKIPDPLRGERKKRKAAAAKRGGSSKSKSKTPGPWSPFTSDPRVQHIAKLDPKFEYLNATVKYDKKVTEEARDLISKMLIIDPKKRLGGGKEGSQEIKEHHFFTNFDWEKLAKLNLKAPFKPPPYELDKNKKLRDKFDFKAVTDNAKEKEFYNAFQFLNAEGLYEEVVDALEDEKAENEPVGECCVIC